MGIKCGLAEYYPFKGTFPLRSIIYTSLTFEYHLNHVLIVVVAFRIEEVKADEYTVTSRLPFWEFVIGTTSPEKHNWRLQISDEKRLTLTVDIED